MRFFSRTIRLIHINIVLLKHGLDRIVWATPLFRPLNVLILFFPWRWFRARHQATGESIRLALEELGPIFVKFGQLLSTRRDLLPDEIADELAKLQDNVPPFDGMLAKSIVEKSLQQPIESVFAEFNITPLASASISQVHPAVLHDGTKVVVKVLRPNVTKQVHQDVQLLQAFAKIIHRAIPRARRFHPIEVVEEIRCTLYEELDFLREAANASQLRRNFSGSDSLYVPQVYWEYSRKNILVTEQIYGVPISDIKALNAKNVDLKCLAERGVEIFFTQVFRDCFFHADMHPGNIFVDTNEPTNPRYIAVDFGIMGTLGPEDQRYLGENFLAFFKRDYRRVAELHLQSGWVPPHTRIESFESAIRTVCEPIFERPLKDISIGQTLLRLFQTARQFDMEVQPQLVLLQKTLLTVEGLGRQLYPDLDLWHTAKPFLEKWMAQHFGPKALLYTLRNKFPVWSAKMPELPEAVYDILRFWQNETHYLSYRHSPLHRTNRKSKRKSHWVLKLLGVGIIAASIALGIFHPSLEAFSQFATTYQAWIIGIAASLGIICLLK